MANAKTIKQCLVEINKAPSVTIPDTVYEYEVDVLREIYGRQAVQIVSTKSVPLPENFGAADAYSQLERKYKGKGGANPGIRQAFPNVQALAKASGLPYSLGDEDDVEYEQSSVIVHGDDDQGDGDHASD